MIVIFDLDDTLYERKDFVLNGLKNVSYLIHHKNKNFNKSKVFNKLKKLNFNKNKKKIFNYFLKREKIKNINYTECINKYRYGKNKIRVYPDAIKLLKIYRKKCYLITDGNKNMQRYKIRLLKIQKYFKKILITNNYGIKNQKPSLFCFNKIKNIENCTYKEMVYVGDNPFKDFVNCNRAGINTIRLLKGDFRKVKKKFPEDAKYKIKSLKELSNLINII